MQLLIAGDLNGHIGAEVDGFSSMHGGFGYGVRNEERRTILEFAVAHDLVFVNSFFKKRDAHIITYHSGDHDTQIDYHVVAEETLGYLYRLQRSFRGGSFSKLDVGIGYQHKETTPLDEDGDTEQMWRQTSKHHLRGGTGGGVGGKNLKVVAGASRTHIGWRESWWFSKEVQIKVKAKHTQFRELIPIHTEVKEALQKMGRNKAIGPDEIPIEAWSALEANGVRWLTSSSTRLYRELKMPVEWRDLPEEWRLNEDKYEGARTCVRTPTENSEYFSVDVELHQGSTISSYLFALILDELSRGIQESIPWCLIFADDIVLVSDIPDGLNGRLEQ
ncbi:retrovirus-related pol polyprotein LINE-1 [Tanacetum coccineum]